MTDPVYNALWVIRRDWGGYGAQCDPRNDYPHFARDVHNQAGDVLTALVPGIVMKADDSGHVGGGIGCQIYIQPSAYPPVASPSTYGQWYCYHFLPGTLRVKVGDRVQAGQPLAMCGYYGHSGPFTHTHTGWFVRWVDTGPRCLGVRPYGPDIGPFLAAIKASNGAVIGVETPVALAPSPPSVSGTSPPSVSGTSGSGGMHTYVPLMAQVHETLVNFPGFYGIALALDEAEQYPGWIDLTQPGSDITVPLPGGSSLDTGIQFPDINGTVRSIGASIVDNTVPFVIRATLVSMGLLLGLMLTWKAINGNAIQFAEPLLKMGGVIV